MLPEYPNLAVRRKVEGWIEIAFVVSATGETRDVEVLGGEKDAYFKNAAIDAVSQWQFKPRVMHGQPIAQRVSAKLTFQFE